jgi:hypothetical protein
MTTKTAPRITKSLRNKVASASDGLPELGLWLARIRAIDDDLLTDAIDGIWCGRDGEWRQHIYGEGFRSVFLCVGWHNGKVEWSYLS